MCFRIVGGKTYYISRKNGKTQNSNLTLYACTTEAFPKQGVDILDAWTRSTGESKELEYSTSKNAKYLFLGLVAGTASVVTEEIRNLAIEGLQVEIVSSKTNYVEHQQTDYLLYIQQEMLKGDYFTKESDGWKEVHAFNKKEFDGTEDIGITSNGNSFTYAINDMYQTSNFNELLNFYSNGYSKSTWTERNVQNKENTIASYMQSIGLYKGNLSTVNDFKEKLAEWKDAGNPLVVFYPLQASIKLPCTEEQSAVLEELNNLDLFEGTNNIITAEDIALLKLKYVADTKMYLENYINSKIESEE